jgi:hypothetical protein
MLVYRPVWLFLRVPVRKKPYRLQLWDMTVTFYSFWTDQHSDIEINRYFFIFERILHFWIFQPPPPTGEKNFKISSRRRRQPKKILKFWAAAADQVIGLHLYLWIHPIIIKENSVSSYIYELINDILLEIIYSEIGQTKD